MFAIRTQTSANVVDGQNCSNKCETVAQLESARSVLLHTLYCIERTQMMRTNQEKVCPQCGRQAPLLALMCEGCSHQYRTQFPTSDTTRTLPASRTAIQELPSTTLAKQRPPSIARTVQQQPPTSKGTMNEYLLGFLAHLVTAKGTYYGGLLVTNTKGVPKEFRHSDAVQPNRVQIILYGDCLASSLGSDTLAPVLYNSLLQKPHVLLIDQASRELFGSFLHQQQPSGMLLETPSASSPPAQQICSEGPTIAAVEMQCKGVPTRKIGLYLEDDSKNPQSLAALTTAQKTMNLLTPFDRIRTVLTELAEYDLARKKV